MTRRPDSGRLAIERGGLPVGLVGVVRRTVQGACPAYPPVSVRMPPAWLRTVQAASGLT